MISINDTIPSASAFVLGGNGPESIDVERLFKGKNVAVIGVPAAFSGTCSNAHIPNYLNHEEALRAAGVDSLICLSVNDAFVMGAWGRQMNVAGRIIMLGDATAELTKAMGLEVDLAAAGLGIRSQRYAMLVKNMKVTYLAVEANTGKLDSAKAEHLLTYLSKEKTA